MEISPPQILESTKTESIAYLKINGVTYFIETSDDFSHIRDHKTLRYLSLKVEKSLAARGRYRKLKPTTNIDMNKSIKSATNDQVEELFMNEYNSLLKALPDSLVQKLGALNLNAKDDDLKHSDIVLKSGLTHYLFNNKFSSEELHIIDSLKSHKFRQHYSDKQRKFLTK